MYVLLVRQIPINWYDYVLKTIIFKNDFDYFETLYENAKMI